MSIEVRVSSFRKQAVFALAIFLCVSCIILGSKLIKKRNSDRFSHRYGNENGTEDFRETVIERDVEVNCLEPFLFKLGFARQDWKRQLPIRIGREQRKFPDYAINISGNEDDIHAEYMWEAKYSITTQSQLRNDWGQARSYGLLLRCRAIGLVSKEGIWYATADDDFAFSSLRHFTWDELEEEDAFESVKKVFAKHGVP